MLSIVASNFSLFLNKEKISYNLICAFTLHLRLTRSTLIHSQGTQRDAFIYWLLNIVEQNRPYVRFQKILADLHRSLANFLLKQFHEVPSCDQMKILKRAVLQHCDVDGECISNENEKEDDDIGLRSKHPPPLAIRGLLWRSPDDS